MDKTNVIACLLFCILLLNFIGYLNNYRLPSFIRNDDDSDNSDDKETIYYNDKIHKTSNSIKPVTVTRHPSPPRHDEILKINVSHRTTSSQATTSTPDLLTRVDRLHFRSWKESGANDSHKLFVFTAWLDDRRLEMKERSTIKIIVISMSDKDLQSSLSCSYSYESGSKAERIVKVLSFNTIGPKVILDNQSLQGYVVTCPVLSNVVPGKVSLHFDGFKGAEVPIQEPEQISSSLGKRYELTACVSANFLSDRLITAADTLDKYRALEWAVTQKMLGVEHVTVYLNLINQRHVEIMQVLRSYVQSNPQDMTLLYYDYINKSPGKAAHRLHTSPIACDCFFSYLGTSKRVMHLGLEEFLIPKKKLPLPQILEQLESHGSHNTSAESGRAGSSESNFIFQMNYFFPNFSPRFSVTPYSIVLRYLLKSTKINRTKHVRSVVSTLTCLVTEFHGCRLSTMNSQMMNPHHVVDSVATIHNYQSCDDDVFDCRNVLSSSVIDDSILKFERLLVEILRKSFIKYFFHNL